MPKFWMISDRNKVGKGLGAFRDDLTFWVSDADKLDKLTNWQKLEKGDFIADLLRATDEFPLILDPEKHQDQKHITFFVPGFNTNWKDAVNKYQAVWQKLFQGENSMGICVLFNWPSDGLVTNYLPDRIDARICAPDFAEVLSDLYDHLLQKQIEGAADAQKSCRAKISLIAHSMGNFLLQKAMQLVWTRKNQPLLVSLINQLIMVAADVDNDLFKSGELIDKSDGDAMANLCYRITALYTGRDPVLGLSSGLKHFGKRRLGRSGLDRSYPLPDNVWDIDCSTYFPQNFPTIHTGYFKIDAIYDLMRALLKGIDRTVLIEMIASREL